MISNNNSTEPTPSSSSSQHISFKDLCKSLIKEETNFEESSDNNNNGYLIEREGEKIFFVEKTITVNVEIMSLSQIITPSLLITTSSERSKK